MNTLLSNSGIKDIPLIATLAGAMILGAHASVAAELGDVDDPIKLAINEWTGQIVSTHIAGTLLMKLGYEVEYVTAGNYPQHQALGDGDIHASLEVWTNNAGDIYPIMKEAGKIVDIGSLGLNPGEGWIYPMFMEELCPGLPDWQALVDCKDAMVTADTFPQGRVLSYPADWGTRSADIIKGLGLDYKAVPAGSEGALVAELQAAAAKEEALVMMFWSPHWVLAEVDVGWVALPAYDPACSTDPAWGPNPDEVNDCGVEAPDTMKVAWAGFQEKWPAAWELLSAFTLERSEQEQMMLQIDSNGRPLEEVVAEWVDANEAMLMPLVDAAKM